MEYDAIRFAIDKNIMPLYLDTAKTYMNISSGALALTMVFREKIVGSSPGSRVSMLLVLTWLSFLITIGASAFYQYLAVKFLDSISERPGAIQYFGYLVSNPGKVYGFMLVFFFVSASLLVLACWLDLPKSRR